MCSSDEAGSCEALTICQPADGEKAGEERVKEKEKREETPTETTDAKEKTEVADLKKGTSHRPDVPRNNVAAVLTGACTSFTITEEVKGEKDAGKEVKLLREDAPRGNGKPPAERPRFMFNIADGGFTG